MQPGTRHFRCTECGACCNRSPEVGLSEAAPLSDQFVFRLMFRLYRFPKRESARGSKQPSENAASEQRRHIAQFAARKTSATMKPGDGLTECEHYLVISALPLDIPPGSCAALHNGRCGLYERRPLSCRTVPAHYSRAEALAGRDIDAFTRRPGYRCDTGPGAEIVLEGGRIVTPEIAEARARAVDLARADRTWNAAILQRMTAGAEAQASLPSLQEVEDNAARGATTTSMRVAWQIARDAGLLDTPGYLTALRDQLRLIETELALARAAPGDLDILAAMRAEYRQCVDYEERTPQKAPSLGARLRRFWTEGGR